MRLFCDLKMFLITKYKEMQLLRIERASYTLLSSLKIRLCFILLILSVSLSFAQENKPIVISDTTFVNLSDFSKDFVYDMRYATPNNFLKQKVYDCEQCVLRYKTVTNLVAANNDFLKKGLRIVLLDCYRPLAIQKRMWELVPDANFVANPNRGSIHNRGGAVDITLLDLTTGKCLDMGTEFDYFGVEASHLYKELSKEVFKNRKLLRKIMKKHHFESLDSEWWHYSLEGARKDSLSNFNWQCN